MAVSNTVRIAGSGGNRLERIWHEGTAPAKTDGRRESAFINREVGKTGQDLTKGRLSVRIAAADHGQSVVPGKAPRMARVAIPRDGAGHLDSVDADRKAAHLEALNEALNEALIEALSRRLSERATDGFIQWVGDLAVALMRMDPDHCGPLSLRHR